MLSSTNGLFSLSPKPDEWLNLEFLDWMNSVIDYCDENSSQITIAEELKKFIYAKACCDWGVCLFRDPKVLPDPNSVEISFLAVSNPSSKITSIHHRFIQLKSRVMSDQGPSILNFDSLKQSLIDKIERSKNNYQGLEKFKFKFLRRMANILKKKNQNAHTAYRDINSVLREYNQNATEERRLLMQAVRGQHAWAAVCMPSYPLDGTRVRQIYKEVCLLCKLQSGFDLLPFFDEVKDEVKDQLIKVKGQLIKDMEDYKSPANKVSDVKKSFMEKLLNCMKTSDVNKAGAITSCKDGLAQLLGEAKSAKEAVKSSSEIWDHPFYKRSFKGVSRVESLHTRSCELVKYAQAVSALLLPSDDSRIIEGVKDQLIKDMKDYQSEGDRVSQVKRRFIENLCGYMEAVNLHDTNAVTACKERLEELSEDAARSSKRMPFGTHAAVTYAERFDPFYSESGEVSRVKSLYMRSCDLIKCAHAVSSLSNPSVDGQTNKPPTMVA